MPQGYHGFYPQVPQHGKLLPVAGDGLLVKLAGLWLNPAPFQPHAAALDSHIRHKARILLPLFPMLRRDFRAILHPPQLMPFVPAIIFVIAFNLRRGGCGSKKHIAEPERIVHIFHPMPYYHTEPIKKTPYLSYCEVQKRADGAFAPSARKAFLYFELKILNMLSKGSSSAFGN